MLDINKLQSVIDKNAVPQTTDMMIQRALAEATYYGKNEKLVYCEEIVQKMIDLGHRDGHTTSDFANYQRELANQLAEIFGFAELSFNSSIAAFFPGVFIATTAPGGCTLCQAVIVKYTKISAGKLSGGTTQVIDFDKNHKGIVFKPGSRYVMRMYLGMDLFMDYGANSMTAQEIMAIILHEIGHNFYVGPIRELSVFALSLLSIEDMTELISLVVFTQGVMPISAEVDRIIPEDIKKSIAQVTNSVGWMMQPFWNVCSVMISIFNLISVMRIMIGDLILNMDVMVKRTIRAGFKYDSEKYSDSFATAYGYGPELSTALAKLNRIRFKLTAKNKSADQLINFLYGMCNLPLNMLLCLTDEHPGHQARLMNNIKYLEACGKNIDNPVVRKQYEQDIKRIHALRDDVKKLKTDDMKVSEAVVASIQDIVNVSDAREFFSSLHPKFTKYYNLDVTV